LGLLTTWLLAATVSGQTPSPTGNLFGTVLDPQGNALRGVTVTVAGPGAPQTANSDANGGFHFLDLSPGDYSVTLERAGFETARRDVTVALGNVVLSITLPVAGVAEAVTVSDETPSLDSRRVVTGATFGQKELEGIPTSRDPWAIVRMVPGVLVEGVSNGGVTVGMPAFVGKGAPGSQNTFNFDGVGVSVGGITPFFYDFDSLSTIEVTTGGSDLSLATPGVTLNLVTKRGTNELRGSARGLYYGGDVWDYGIEAGGPLWKDRLWLWGAFAHTEFPGGTIFNNVGEPIPSELSFKHWNAKVNAQLVPGNALTLAYTNFERVFVPWLFSPDLSAEASYRNSRPGILYKIEDSQVLSPNLFASFYLSYVKTRSTNLPLGGLDQQAYQDDEGIWRHSYKTRLILDDKHQAGLNVSDFFDTGGLRHELKFGFGYRHLRFDSGASWPGDQLVGYGDPWYTAAVTRLKNARAEVNVYDAFVGDTIQTGNLTVNVGVRFDYQQGKNLPSSVPANPIFPEILPAVQYAGDSGYPFTWRLFQPRVGATYALDQGRTLLRASYARFANELNSATVVLINAFPDIAAIEYLWEDANGNGRVEPGEMNLSSGPVFWGFVDPNNPTSSQQINQIAPDYETPTTDELIIGVERQIAPDLSGSIAYTYRVFRNLEFSPLIGTTRASYQYVGNATGTAVDTATGFVLNFSEPYYALTECPPPCIGTVLSNRRDASETYSGFELQLLKSFSHGWMARVSFGYNNSQQHIGPDAIVNPNNEPPGTNASGPGVEGGMNAIWQFNVSGMVELPLGIAAGVNFFGRQGFPILYYVDAFTDDPAVFVYPIQIGSATDYRNPNVYQLDLQLSKPFRIGSAVTVIPQIDCFNLLGSRTVLARSGFVGTYNATLDPALDPSGGFNEVIEELSPRTFRGGVRVTF
jgi:hypothetical protein